MAVSVRAEVTVSTVVRIRELQQLLEQEEWFSQVFHLNRFYGPIVDFIRQLTQMIHKGRQRSTIEGFQCGMKRNDIVSNIFRMRHGSHEFMKGRVLYLHH